MNTSSRPLAIVTGASTGIGYELAVCCLHDGYDVIVSANEPQIEESAKSLREIAGSVEALEADLSTPEGVGRLIEMIADRPVSALLANAGLGLGRSFLEQKFEDIQHVIDTNITGTIYLIHHLAAKMRERGAGNILITGSIAGLMPAPYQTVYNASKSFLDSFSYGLRAELADSGVSVTCLMPGPTQTEFFRRAHLMDTVVGRMNKDDPQMLAQKGFAAMKKGEADIVPGWQNKLQAAMARVIPVGVTSRLHGRLLKPDADGNSTENRSRAS